MSYEFYKVLHVVGIILVFMTLGASVLHAATQANLANPQPNPQRKLIAALNGTGLLLIIVAGFGMLAKLQLMSNLPGWLHPKLLVWLLIAASPTLLARKPGTAKAMFFVLPLLGAVAAYFGVNH